jgi:predicted acetyltransferase
MDVRQVSLRKVTPAEYAAATEHRGAGSVRVLSRFMPEEVPRERVLRVGDNEAAIALYRRNGYEVASMCVRKAVQQGPLSCRRRLESGLCSSC